MPHDMVIRGGAQDGETVCCLPGGCGTMAAPERRTRPRGGEEQPMINSMRFGAALVCACVAWGCAGDGQRTETGAEERAPGVIREPVVADAGNPNPGVLPIGSHPHGKTYGEWGAAWWKWVYAQPFSTNPVSDKTGAHCADGQSGPVWFLAGSFGTTEERSCTIPPGKTLFFPIFNIFNDYPCPDPNFHPAPGRSLYDFLAAGARAFIDPATALGVEVDGKLLANPWGYRAASGLEYFTGDLSWQPFDPCITGTQQEGVSDGYWTMLAPLTPGPHTVRITAGAPGFSLDVTYNLTIGH